MLNPIALVAASSLSSLPLVDDLVVLPSEAPWTLLALSLEVADIARYSDIAQQGATWLSWALARQHSALAAIGAAVAVYPLQFGLVVPSVDETLAAAGQHHQELVRYFALIEGACEWSLKASLSEAVAESDVQSANISGLAWLKAKQSAPQRRALRIENAQLRVRAEITSIVASARASTLVHRQTVLPNKPGTELLNMALLVETQDGERLTSAADKLRETLATEGIVVSWSGPWPPYSFRPRLA